MKFLNTNLVNFGPIAPETQYFLANYKVSTHSPLYSICKCVTLINEEIRPSSKTMVSLLLKIDGFAARPLYGARVRCQHSRVRQNANYLLYKYLKSIENSRLHIKRNTQYIHYVSNISDIEFKVHPTCCTTNLTSGRLPLSTYDDIFIENFIKNYLQQFYVTSTIQLR